MAYKDEIASKELLIGEVYTSKQLEVFQEENHNIIYLSDPYWTSGSERKFKLLDIQRKQVDRKFNVSSGTVFNVYTIESIPE
ncbi:hypothetical protein [Terribacillus saccharophilus]|uniref:hypothetical protein n=1 Tax=Terribacillus saccharophilus TaxID=361277 RepID=UPI002DC78830|nr:hypothetical protein [Terribacillus saccharophilus]MEC0288798.1 hypothetical protein [Terribacillus saccharophilus]